MLFSFIHVFLGLTVLSSPTFGDEVIQSVSGVVEGGNYTYYSLKYEGPISLVLYTVEGDADLYVSENNLKPTFDPDNYCLQAVTCGIDRIDIPASFKRPVGIGVYGHPNSILSSYILEVVYRDEEEIDHFKEEEEKEEARHKKQKFSDVKNGDDEPLLWTVIWSVLEVLLEVLIS